VKIALLCLTYGFGGAGNHVNSLAKNLAEMGHDVTVFAGPCNGSVDDGPPVEIVRLDFERRRGFPSIWSWYFRRLLADKREMLSQFDVINGNPVVGDLVVAAKRLRIPYVATLHGSLRAMYCETRALRRPHPKPRTIDRLDN
jgi:glycosyltransferase involved in cell wall biosynthesis